jgi:hypothetical protein
MTRDDHITAAEKAMRIAENVHDSMGVRQLHAQLATAHLLAAQLKKETAQWAR